MDLITSIGDTLNAMTNNSFYGKLAIGAASIATAYFAPIVGLLFACFACTSVDLVYGLKVAKRLGKKITSSKSWKGTLRKIKDEFTIIMLAHLLEYTVMGEHSITILSGGATALICVTELWSILENLNTLDPEGPWRILGQFLRKKGQDYTGIEIQFKNETNSDIKVDIKPQEGR